MKIARVYFWDGYRFGPMVQTNDEELRERLEAVAGIQLPADATAMFVAQSLANGRPAGVWNAAPARTVGQQYTFALDESNWPAHPGDQWEAGVFILDLKTGECSVIGGLGFGHEEQNPRQLRTELIVKMEEGQPDAED